MSTVLVTGGCGCVAQHLVRELIVSNSTEGLNIKKIILIDIQKEWKPFWHFYAKDQYDNIYPFPTIDQENEMIEFYSVDLSNEQQLKELFETEIIPKHPNLTTIFHVMSAIALWAPSEDFFDKLNVKVTNYLLDISFHYDCIKNFIYTSSGNIFYKPHRKDYEFTYTTEEEYQTVERNDKGEVTNVKLEFEDNLPKSIDYAYSLSKRKANQLVVRRTFSERKKLNTVCLALCTALYGEADSFAKTVIQSGHTNVKINAKSHNLYAGNAAVAHVKALKALQDEEKSKQVRGMTFIVHEGNFDLFSMAPTREIMKYLTNDHVKYDEKNAKSIPLIFVYLICYMFLLYNFFIYILTFFIPKTRSLYASPLITNYTIDIVYSHRRNDYNIENIQKYLGYKPKYKPMDNYKQIALYYRILVENGQIQLPIK